VEGGGEGGKGGERTGLAVFIVEGREKEAHLAGHLALARKQALALLGRLRAYLGGTLRDSGCRGG